MLDGVDAEDVMVVVFAYDACRPERRIVLEPDELRLAVRETADCGLPITAVDVYTVTWEDLPDPVRIGIQRRSAFDDTVDERTHVATVRDRRVITD